MDIKEESLKKHYEWKGKIGVEAKVAVNQILYKIISDSLEVELNMKSF